MFGDITGATVKFKDNREDLHFPGANRMQLDGILLHLLEVSKIEGTTPHNFATLNISEVVAIIWQYGEQKPKLEVLQ